MIIHDGDDRNVAVAEENRHFTCPGARDRHDWIGTITSDARMVYLTDLGNNRQS